MFVTHDFRTSLWRRNQRYGVSNHQPHDCLLKRLFRHISKKTSKLRVTGLCEGNSPVTGEFPAQRASNAENVSIWRRQSEWNMKLVPLGPCDKCIIESHMVSLTLCWVISFYSYRKSFGAWWSWFNRYLVLCDLLSNLTVLPVCPKCSNFKLAFRCPLYLVIAKI